MAMAGGARTHEYGRNAHWCALAQTKGKSMMPPVAAVAAKTTPPPGRDDCRGLAQIIDRVGDKWTVMVVGHLSEHGAMRFNALMRAIPGVSHRMLTLTLRGLERDGLVRRTPYATVPVRVDYELTTLGRSLTEPLAILARWASARRKEIETARAEYDSTRSLAA